MKTRILCGIGAALAATACVRSLEPFCATGADRPDLNGTWMETDREGRPQPGSRWLVAGRRVAMTNDAQRTGGELNALFFQAGDAWFVDTSPGAVSPEPNGWWRIHTAELHHLARIDLAGARLTATPLDQDWLLERVKASDPRARGIRVADEQQRLFAGSPEAWSGLLRAIARDAAAFPADRALILARAQDAP